MLVIELEQPKYSNGDSYTTVPCPTPCIYCTVNMLIQVNESASETTDMVIRRAVEVPEGFKFELWIKLFPAVHSDHKMTTVPTFKSIDIFNLLPLTYFKH